MKVGILSEKARKMEKVAISFDVGQEKLNMYFECVINGKLIFYEDEFENRSDIIQMKLVNLIGYIGRNTGIEIRIVCEPTGGYEKELIRTSRVLGIECVYVSGEAVSKLKILENNNNDKTDRKDPRVISMAEKYGKTFAVRILTGFYGELRDLNTLYDHCRDNKKISKCRLHHITKKLFFNLTQKNGFLYSKAGRMLIKEFNLNPHRIIKAGQDKFENTMRKAAPGVHCKTLKQIWKEAERSTINPMLDTEQHRLEFELKITWDEYLIFEKNKDLLRNKIIDCYFKLRSNDSSVPQFIPGLISEFSMARILGETGPLDDFKTIRQLFKYTGLNIRERQSGSYRGKNKICKKGRSRIRAILHMAVAHLTTKGRIFAEEYKRKTERMEPKKALTALSRKLLKTIFGINKSKDKYCIERVFVCESKYIKDEDAA